MIECVKEVTELFYQQKKEEGRAEVHHECAAGAVLATHLMGTDGGLPMPRGMGGGSVQPSRA